MIETFLNFSVLHFHLFADSDFIGLSTLARCCLVMLKKGGYLHPAYPKLAEGLTWRSLGLEMCGRIPKTW